VSISAKVEYGCLAALELAMHYADGQPIQVRRISDRHQIPCQFLVQILLQLKAAGLVESIRGPHGGYRLAKDPADLTLAEIMETMDRQFSEPALDCVEVPVAPTVQVLKDTWRELAETQRQILNSVTLDVLAERVRVDAGAMYYI